MGVRIRHIILQIVAYTLYALVAFGVFVYVLFPYDLLQQRLVEWVSQEGVQLVLTRLRPAFPPGLRAEDIRLQVDQLSPSAATLHINTLRVQPDWLALLARKMQLRFEAKLYSGHLEGDAHYAKVEDTPVWDIKTRFTDLDVAQHALLRKDDKAFIRGRLSGDSAVALTSDGQVQPLRPGIHLLIKKMAMPIVPIGIAGAYDAWPRWRAYPIPAPLFLPAGKGTIAVSVGPPPALIPVADRTLGTVG